MTIAEVPFQATGFDVLIVGTGHAAAHLAAMLAQARFEGSIAMIGEENELPYERPPLSKDYLSGTKAFERILIRRDDFWGDRGITLLLGRRVTSVDPVEHEVRCATGEAYRYGQLVWAAGGTPRRLSCPGHDLAGVHTIRTRADADRLRDELPHVGRVVVIGGGYIGLEAAAVLAKAGKTVVLIEALGRVLARVAGEPLSRFFEREHRRHGVEIRLDTGVESLIGHEGRVAGVRLADGTIEPCDLVIVGIGIIPATEPLQQAGASGDDGVAVDGSCRTSLRDIFAIGDCAAHTNKYAGGCQLRVESVQNANDQAAVVAKVLSGEGAIYDAIPWFWSHQYDLKLQTIGISRGYDQVVVRGDPATRSFSILYFCGGRVIALDCVNATRDYVQGRSLVANGTVVDPTIASDATIPLKELGAVRPV